MFALSRSNTLRYDPAQCLGCKRCEEVCPHGVFAMTDGLATLLRPQECMECGACRLNCPTDAIEVESGVGCAWTFIREALTRRPQVCEC